MQLYDINQALETLKKGGIILYPTDTVWGIGCDATNDAAVRRIYALKQRVDTKAMLVLTDSVARLETYVSDVPEIAYDLLDAAVNPLTIIYPKGRNLAPSLYAADGSVGIRVTNEEFSQTLCYRFRKPIVSTSANISGRPSPSNFSEISEEIRSGVDYICSYRRDDTSKCASSEIIRLGAGNQVEIIRGATR
ncbi:MAG: threonylcarbamoyl-AMP synthase [Tannerella sp.]|jgi:L-threonylcarbamoyladenylate synthase|nr:threonylcarbamoyl-AMP synthase [Tannerella sp.]